MTLESVARVRSFNRLVSQRIGALEDHYLSRDRPLGEARVLWEIGESGADIRDLRARLDLDSGYVSRLLQALERDGLVLVRPSAADRRVRTAHLTAAGRRERHVLERRSDELARSLLAPLRERQQEQLVAAMGEVERLLSAALVRIDIVDPAKPEAQACLNAYVTELGRRFDSGFDPTRSIPAELHELRPPAGIFLLATLHSLPVGCGGLKFHGPEPAELKRMWVADSARGLGIGRRLLEELEQRAAAAGAPAVRLETNRALREAIGLYRSAGYVEVEAFNREPYAHHWFEKRFEQAKPG